MPSPTQIAASQFCRLIGVPAAPVIVDVRSPKDFAADPRVIPGARCLDPEAASRCAPEFFGQTVVVYCRDDLAQLDMVMALYDAFYRWCRDAVEETHG